MPDKTVHVEPINDLVEHVDHDCICGPTTEVYKREDGGYGFVVVHHSLDGRENNE